MPWFRRKVKFTRLQPAEQPKAREREMPAGLWTRCDNCEEYVTNEQLDANLRVCPKCNFYYRLDARMRIASLVDPDGFHELDSKMTSCDPLGFDGYQAKLAQNQKKTGLTEAVVSGWGTMNGRKISIAVIDFSFMGASMGSVVGEKITCAAERSHDERAPLLIVSSSGGARMQEGMLSLMQMAKTSAAVARMREVGVPYISLMTNPTTAGVAASFAALGDVIVSEPCARIGFAGPRVIEQTIGQRLPDGFQTAEFLVEHGMVDMIVPRHELREELTRLLNHLCTRIERDAAQQASDTTPQAVSAAASS